MTNNNYIFNLIKENKFEEIYDLIKNATLKNLNFQDKNYNYFIHYIINYNQIKLLNLIIELKLKNLINITIDILDVDGRSILYNCIKYNYIELINIFIKKYNNNIIGISILDIKDKLGFIGLHYSIIFNNYDAFKLLIENGSDPYILSYDGNNSFFLCLIYKRNDILDYLLKNLKNINFNNKSGENLLQLAVYYNNTIIIDKLLETSIDLNNQTLDYGLTILHQSIILNNYDLFIKLLNKQININLPDFYGNTALHFIISNKKINYLKDIIVNKNIKYNISNINGELPLHILIDNYNNFIDIDINIINKILIETDLNMQNNNGETCLMKIISQNLLDKFKDILIIKPLNLFIENNDNKTIILNNKIINIAIESFYNQLKLNKNNLLINWEKWCSEDDFKKLKILYKNHKNKNICKSKIKEVIINEKRSLPKLNIIPIYIEHGIYINSCLYTGMPIDILFGLILLHNTFKSKNLNIILDYPITINKDLELYYKKIGLYYPYILDFSNIEIIWCYQHIFYPSYFDEEIQKCIKNKVKFIIIPIGIETAIGAHANILFWNLAEKTIERFEPNGANYPIGLNYNPELLDNLLLNKFKLFDENIIYYPPYKFLPTIGFQLLESLETEKCKKIGDPNGFCGVWCIWWVYQRIININNQFYNITNIADELIKNIKFETLYFKNIIRNFSEKIYSLRDNALKKYNLDINDWIVGNYTQDILYNLEKDILHNL